MEHGTVRSDPKTVIICVMHMACLTSLLPFQIPYIHTSVLLSCFQISFCDNSCAYDVVSAAFFHLHNTRSYTVKHMGN